MLTGYLLQSVGPLWTIALFAACLVLLALEHRSSSRERG